MIIITGPTIIYQHNGELHYYWDAIKVSNYEEK